MSPVTAGRCILWSFLAAAVSLAWAGQAPASPSREAQQQEMLAEKVEAGFDGPAALPADPTADEYLAYAASRNPGLRAAFHEWIGMLDRASAVSSLPEPVLSYMYFGESVETRVGPQRQRLGIRQAFPWFGTLKAREMVAEQEAWAAYRRFQSKRLELAFEVRKAYSEHYLLGRRVEITRSTLGLLRSWEAVSRARFEAGRSGRTDLVRIEIEIARAEDSLRSLEDSRAASAERMISALGASDTLEVPFPSGLPEPAVIDPDTVLAAVLRNNPAIMALDHMILREENAVRLAGKSSWPDLSLGFDYIDTGPSLDPGMPESGKDPWMVSISLELPVWIHRNRALKEEAAARLEMNRYSRKDAVSGLRAGAQKALSEFRDAEARAALYFDTLIPKAEESLAITLKEYETGEADFLDVLDAQRLLLDLRIEMEEALAKREIKSAQLEMLAGRELRPAK